MTNTRNLAINTRWGHANQTASILHRHTKRLNPTKTYLFDLLPQYILTEIDILTYRPENRDKLKSFIMKITFCVTPFSSQSPKSYGRPTSFFVYKAVGIDLFQPKTDLFSTRALIWVHFKTVRYFHQPIFSSFSYLKNALHNLVIELCSALYFLKNNLQLYINFTHSFVDIELLTFYKNEKILLYCSRELSLFWLNK